MTTHPDADFLVPLPAKLSRARKIWAWLDNDDDDDAPTGEFGLLVGLDKLTVVAHRAGVSEEPAENCWGLPMAALTVVQPGVVRGAPDKTFSVTEIYGDSGARVSVVDGPAVWLAFGDQDWIIATPDPVGLAGEIDRRRRRVVRIGGFAAAEVWERVPELRADLPVLGAPAHPQTLPHGAWTPLRPAPPGQPSPGMAPRRPLPLHGAQHPKEFPDLAGPHWMLSGRVFALAGRRPFPLASIRVADAGVLTNLPHGHRLPNGPGLWCWGHHGEFLLPTPDAASLAAEITARTASCLAHPEGLAEEKVWIDFPDSRPTGPFVPPPPPYAPAEPTIVPKGCWQLTR